MPQRMSRSARLLGLTLGLGDLTSYEPCMGYANACICTDCRGRHRAQIARELAVTNLPPRQPWEAITRKAA